MQMITIKNIEFAIFYEIFSNAQFVNFVSLIKNDFKIFSKHFILFTVTILHRHYHYSRNQRLFFFRWNLMQKNWHKFFETLKKLTYESKHVIWFELWNKNINHDDLKSKKSQTFRKRNWLINNRHFRRKCQRKTTIEKTIFKLWTNCNFIKFEYIQENKI